jgi:hypothetical protein
MCGSLGCGVAVPARIDDPPPRRSAQAGVAGGGVCLSLGVFRGHLLHDGSGAGPVAELAAALGGSVPGGGDPRGVGEPAAAAEG